MIKKFLTAIAVFAAMAFSMNAFAFKVATGDATKNSIYGIMNKDFMEICPDTGFQVTTTTGSNKSLELLTSNKVSGAYVQSDFLFFVKNNDPAKVKDIKVLFGLHPEALHFVGRAKLKSGGFLGYGAKEIVMTEIAHAAGRPVGAVGGSVTTALIVESRTKLGFKVMEYSDNNALVAALNEGKVDVALFVGGTDYGFIKGLSRDFRLLTVGAKEQASLVGEGAPYTPISITYDNLGQAGVRTIATQAVFATYDYKSPKFKQTLAAVKQCFDDNLTSIAEEPGTSPTWRTVVPGKTGGWPAWKP